MRKIALEVILFSFLSLCFHPILEAGERTGEGLTVVWEKESYNAGEAVCFALRNGSTRRIEIPSAAPWVIMSGDKPIFSPLSPQRIVSIPPGGAKTWCWDQRDDDRRPVPSGLYRLIFSLIGKEMRHEFYISPVKGKD
jgi:hypothetical protein